MTSCTKSVCHIPKCCCLQFILSTFVHCCLQFILSISKSVSWCRLETFWGKWRTYKQKHNLMTNDSTVDRQSNCRIVKHSASISLHITCSLLMICFAQKRTKHCWTEIFWGKPKFFTRKNVWEQRIYLWSILKHCMSDGNWSHAVGRDVCKHVETREHGK